MIVHTSFESPAWVDHVADREPTATLSLLAYLDGRTHDDTVRKQIVDERVFVLEQVAKLKVGTTCLIANHTAASTVRAIRIYRLLTEPERIKASKWPRMGDGVAGVLTNLRGACTLDADSTRRILNVVRWSFEAPQAKTPNRLWRCCKIWKPRGMPISRPRGNSWWRKPLKSSSGAMHIPDGYLSPATCATLYGGAAPLLVDRAAAWMRRGLNTHMVRSCAVGVCGVLLHRDDVQSSALPGGTTGHALVAWAFAAIVLRAVGFYSGDFDCAGDSGPAVWRWRDPRRSARIVLTWRFLDRSRLTGIYRLVAGRAPIESPRRVLAAGLAGYLAINFSALAAAIEFGLRPLLYRDAAGAAHCIVRIPCRSRFRR